MARADEGANVQDLLHLCGFGDLGKDPAPESIEAALRKLAGHLNGADPLRREVVRTAALKKLKEAGIPAPARLLDAALAPPEADDAEAVAVCSEPPEIVDVVDGGEAGLYYIVASGGMVDVVDEWQGMKPWPRERLPYAPIPHLADYQAAVDAGALPVADELAARSMRAVVLPRPTRAWAYLLAAWVHGSYLLELHDYYPLLLLEGPPERGKTRLGKFLTYSARRGYYTPTPRGPTLVRDRAFHAATLMIDVEDLGRVLERGGELADLVLASFERGARVRLVVRPDAPPEGQVESYAAYGPTLLLTNRAVRAESPLASRCIRIPLPEAGTVDVPPAARPEELAGLRARLVAWAARIRASGAALPEVDVPFRGRLRDMALPVLRVLKLIAPDHVDEVVELLRTMDRERRSEAARSWEARVAVALWAARDRVEAGRLYIRDLTPVVNDGVDDSDQLTEQQVGTARRQLGLGSGKGGRPPRAYIVWPGDDAARALRDRYLAPEEPGVPESSATSEATRVDTGSSEIPAIGSVGSVGSGENPRHDYDASDPSDVADPPRTPARDKCRTCGRSLGGSDPAGGPCRRCRAGGES